MLLYLLTGSFGYLTFDQRYSTFHFPSQILSAHYGQGNGPIIAVKARQCDLLIAVPIVCAMPLTVQPCRDALYSLIWKDGVAPLKWHVTIVCGERNIGLVGTSLLLGYLAPGIGVVISVLGSISSPMICFVLPCLFYIRLQPSRQLLAWAVLLLTSALSLLSFVLLMVSF